MFSIIEATPQYLSNIYSMILALAKQEGILDKVQLNEAQLGGLLFCNNPNHFVAIARMDGKLVGLVFFSFINHNA